MHSIFLKLDQTNEYNIIQWEKISVCLLRMFFINRATLLTFHQLSHSI